MVGGQVPTESSQPGCSATFMSMDRIELERKSLEVNITDKLEHIEEIIKSKLDNCDKETDKLRVKINYISEQVERTVKKFEK